MYIQSTYEFLKVSCHTYRIQTSLSIIVPDAFIERQVEKHKRLSRLAMCPMNTRLASRLMNLIFGKISRKRARGTNVPPSYRVVCSMYVVFGFSLILFSILQLHSNSISLRSNSISSFLICIYFFYSFIAVILTFLFWFECNNVIDILVSSLIS